MSKAPVYAWYFPNWHPTPKNDVWHGKGWTEWEVAKCARPRFEGHLQPRVPLWGYEDESNPQVMEKKIDAALSHGIEGFLWDFYWTDSGPYRLGALENGFFGARNNKDFKIALMWCNHDPIYVHPNSRMYPRPPLEEGNVSVQTFLEMTTYCIENCFPRENYLRVDGAAYFILWDLNKMLTNFGGVEGTRVMLDDFRARAQKAGIRLHLATELSHVEGYRKDRETYNRILKAVGIESVVNYSWPNGKPLNDDGVTVDYAKTRESAVKMFGENTAQCDLPVNITVSLGWDSSPRTCQSDVYDISVGYPFSPVVVGNTPEEIEKSFEEARKFMRGGQFTGRFMTISTWNEWTEGNFMEPDELYGYGYLEALKRVLDREGD